jgi:trk system potassium uptake protein TrkH
MVFRAITIGIKPKKQYTRTMSFVRVIAFLLALISSTMLLPIGFACYYDEWTLIPVFAVPIPLCGVLALLAFLCTRGKRFSITVRGGYIIVASCWFFASVLGAVPFIASGAIPGIVDALFESVSGFTTTGATILSDVEALPVAIGVWRCQLHWLGGMGIIALTVALLPLLGIGGFQLIKAETSGVEKSKITAKITTTAKILWIIYISLTAAETVALMLAGLNFTDALCHAFSTIGSGGFSTRNGSIGAFGSSTGNMICAVFMVLVGVNFALYHNLVTGQYKEVLRNTELKAYLSILLATTLIVAVLIVPQFPSVSEALRAAFFHVASFLSSTAFVTADYMKWTPGAQVILLLLMCIGGCSGSTSGGVKVIRCVVLFKQAGYQFRKLLHPHGVFSMQINKRPCSADLVSTVSAFMFLYLLLVAATGFVAALGGADLVSALSASVSLIGNVGSGVGRVGPAGGYGFFPAPAKLWFSLVMLAGRLELFTILLLFLPETWKRDA